SNRPRTSSAIWTRRCAPRSRPESLERAVLHQRTCGLCRHRRAGSCTRAPLGRVRARRRARSHGLGASKPLARLPRLQCARRRFTGSWADLLAAAKANQHTAIDMVTLWGYGYRAGLGGSAAPGVWMAGTGERILERARPGVLYADLAACNAYRTGLEAA